MIICKDGEYSDIAEITFKVAAETGYKVQLLGECKLRLHIND